MQSKKFAYYARSEGLIIVNYENPAKIRKRTIKSLASKSVTALSVLNGDDYLAIAFDTSTGSSIWIIELENEALLKEILVDSTVTKIVPWRDSTKPTSKIFFYSYQNTIKGIDWMGESITLTISQSITLKDFEMIPAQSELVAIYEIFSYRAHVKLFTIQFSSTPTASQNFAQNYPGSTFGLFNVRTDLIWVNKLYTYQVYRMSRNCQPGFKTVPNTNNLCYRECPANRPFADWRRGNCVASCPPASSTSANAANVHGPKEKVCFPDISCTIENCGKCGNNRCLKCDCTYYIASINGVDDSCIPCSEAGQTIQNPDLNNGYG